MDEAELMSHVQKLELRDGDVLVYRIVPLLNIEGRERISKRLHRIIEAVGVKATVLIADCGAEIQVLRKAA